MGSIQKKVIWPWIWMIFEPNKRFEAEKFEDKYLAKKMSFFINEFPKQMYLSLIKFVNMYVTETGSDTCFSKSYGQQFYQEFCYCINLANSY